MESEENKTSRIRTLAMYAQVSLLMVIGVYMLWAILGSFDAQFIMTRNPTLQHHFEALTKASASNEAVITGTLKLLAPFMHWFKLAMAASIIGFALLGYLLGRLVDDTSWAGALPIFDLLSGMNPAFIGDKELVMPLAVEYQMAVLFTQIIVIQAVAAWSAKRRFAKKKVASN